MSALRKNTTLTSLDIDLLGSPDQNGANVAGLIQAIMEDQTLRAVEVTMDFQTTEFDAIQKVLADLQVFRPELNVKLSVR